jgi:hydroxycarboxylate dehydrogenase B
MVRCQASELRRFAAEVLAAIGMRPDDAEYAAGVIVASDLAGHESHGLRRLPDYVERAAAGRLAPGERPAIELDLGSLLRLDGRRALGHVAFRELVDLAIARARTHGLAGVALRNSSFVGRIADYCERAARAGIATLFWLNDSGGGQEVAPFGGDAKRLSTNPVGVGIPRAREPHFVLDMATSVVAMGHLSEWRDRGNPIPQDWLAPGGALRPFGGHKGAGLALVAEAFAGILSGAGSVRSGEVEDGQGAFCLAIDVARLRPMDEFESEMERMLAYVRDTPLEPGAGPIRFPGEAAAETATRRLAEGLPVQDFSWERMQKLAGKFGILMPECMEGKK